MTRVFNRSGGCYLFWSAAIYLVAGLGLLSFGYKSYSQYAAPIWIAVLALPFVVPPFGRWLHMDITWDQNMFNFGKKKTDNVIKFPEKGLPEPKTNPPMPEVNPPKKSDLKVFYRFGVTDQRDRVAFSMGNMEITMNKKGCQDMIDQLTFFMNKLDDDYETDD